MIFALCTYAMDLFIGCPFVYLLERNYSVRKGAPHMRSHRNKLLELWHASTVAQRTFTAACVYCGTRTRATCPEISHLGLEDSHDGLDAANVKQQHVSKVFEYHRRAILRRQQRQAGGGGGGKNFEVSHS